MKKRRPNKVSKLFRAAAELKAEHVLHGACYCLSVAADSTLRAWPSNSPLSGEAKTVFDSAENLLYDTFAPTEDADTFWWARPTYLGTDAHDPDFEARMLALLLAELIAMEGGL